MFALIVTLLLPILAFTFFYILAKKNGKYFLAPIITFLMAVGLTAYGLIVVGGFEGMAYGMLAVGFLLVSIVGTLLLPILVKRQSPGIQRADKISLAIIPLLFFLTIGLLIWSDKGYWVIEKGVTNGEQEGYHITTILEGKKSITINLGEEYVGKEIQVKKVSKFGPTEITLEIVEGEDSRKPPSIQIGVDEINEPLKIQTTDGKVFHPISKDAKK